MSGDEEKTVMAEKRIRQSVRDWVIELLIVAALLCSALSGLSGATLDAASAEFMASIGHGEARAGNSLQDSIALAGRDELIGSPQNLTPGGEYYSANPILMGQGSGSRTEIYNADSATSMSHEIAAAREVSGETEYLVQSSGIKGPTGKSGFTTTQMKIDETVTDGKVNLGVLVGESGKAGAGSRSLDSRHSAWRNPAIEIDEDYIGTFNISKNLTYNSSFSVTRNRDSWLNCCGDDSIISLIPSGLVSADDVFNCHR
jgi:hypothetical protein